MAHPIPSPRGGLEEDDRQQAAALQSFAPPSRLEATDGAETIGKPSNSGVISPCFEELVRYPG